MSSESNTAVTEEEARRKAAEAVRFNLGTYLRLKPGEFDKDDLQYQFPIVIRSPKLILEADKENAVDVRYLDPVEVGVVTVDAESMEVEHPSGKEIDDKIESYEEEINQVVQKAIVRASGTDLSHLPFPENQYAPLRDLLSELLLNDQVYLKDIKRMDGPKDGDKYSKYVNNLVELDLARREVGAISSGNTLITIQSSDKFRDYETQTLQQQLNVALGLYFEHHIGDFDAIKRILGPYLALTGYYYRRSLELGELPNIKEEELRRGIKSEYKDRREQNEKLFKMSRYLIQLEAVGILESVVEGGNRYWTGNGDTYQRLKRDANQWGSFSPLVSPSLTDQQTLDGLSD